MGYIKKYWIDIISFLIILVLVFGIEFLMGRSVFGPDGKFGLWDGNIWSSENSQRVADPYTFSHIGHGLIFFSIFWFMFRKVPVRYRFIMAVLLEAGWEILENSSFIINRYREATIAVGYVGDSILNSTCDVFWAALGFLFAYKMPTWVSVILFIVMEVGCAIWVRDNLILNVIMLVHPLEWIKTWQAAGNPDL